MIDKIYTLNSGIKVYIIDEVDYLEKKYVLCAVVDAATDKVTEQIAMFEYIVAEECFEAINDESIITEVAKIFSEK